MIFFVHLQINEQCLPTNRTRRAKGKDSLTRLTSSALTILTQRAARQNNELGPEREEERIGTAQQAKQGSEKSEHGRSESGKAESGKRESGKTESGKAESGKRESGKSDSGKSGSRG